MLLSAMVCALSGLGCGGAPYVWVHDLPRRELASAADGRIAIGDVVEVRVFGQDTLTTKGRVRADRSLTLPLVGRTEMAGQQPEALARALTEQYRRFVNDPHVSVVVVESQVQVTAVGEVRQSGVMLLDAPATVLQALAKAGGVTEFADRSQIFVVRPTDGASRRIRFTYDALVDGAAAATNFHLQSGDVLVVE